MPPTAAGDSQTSTGLTSAWGWQTPSEIFQNISAFLHFLKFSWLGQFVKRRISLGHFSVCSPSKVVIADVENTWVEQINKTWTADQLLFSPVCSAADLLQLLHVTGFGLGPEMQRPSVCSTLPHRQQNQPPAYESVPSPDSR